MERYVHIFANIMTDVVFLKADVEKLKDTAKVYKIGDHGLPHFLIFKKNKVILNGYTNKPETLERFLLPKNRV